jgi:hypothetical protein
MWRTDAGSTTQQKEVGARGTTVVMPPRMSETRPRSRGCLATGNVPRCQTSSFPSPQTSAGRMASRNRRVSPISAGVARCHARSLAPHRLGPIERPQVKAGDRLLTCIIDNSNRLEILFSVTFLPRPNRGRNLPVLVQYSRYSSPKRSMSFCSSIRVRATRRSGASWTGVLKPELRNEDNHQPSTRSPLGLHRHRQVVDREFQTQLI